MATDKNGKLALLGGEPIRRGSWPQWPRASKGTERNLLDVLHSGRWAISGMYNGTQLYEERFAEAFAAFNSVNYCVPVANGSAALIVALEALGVGYGKEVLVPGITWVACASAVTRIGAIPVLVDVDRETLCMSVDAARAAITDRTAAILLVHLYSSAVDIDAFLSLSTETGIPLLEDCSQAHGALWNGQRVGSFGEVSAFSMQDTKVLTSGEGGAALTNSPEMYDRMQQIRADGRRYRDGRLNHLQLEEVGAVQGYNLCLSEFQSAILLDRLQHLDVENEIRRENAAYLDTLFSEVGGVIPQRQPEQLVPTYYHYCARVERKAFGSLDINTITQAVTEELDIPIEPIDNPLTHNILYNPLLSNRYDPSMRTRLDPLQFDLPNAIEASKEFFTIPHRALLGAQQDVEDIANAFHKVKRNQSALQRFISRD